MKRVLVVLLLMALLVAVAFGQTIVIDMPGESPVLTAKNGIRAVTRPVVLESQGADIFYEINTGVFPTMSSYVIDAEYATLYQGYFPDNAIGFLRLVNRVMATMPQIDINGHSGSLYQRGIAVRLDLPESAAKAAV